MFSGGCQHLGAKAARLPPAEAQSPVAAIEARPVSGVPEAPAFAPGNLRAEEIPGAIAGLELSLRNPQASEEEKAEALRRLALLHLAAHNPSRSLSLAAEAQKGYLKLRPAETAGQEGEIWLNLIEDTLAGEQLLQQQAEKIREKENTLRNLGAERQRLALQLANQEALNAKLKADIEKLKSIDISVAQKRNGAR
jgi:hypothetical protein